MAVFKGPYHTDRAIDACLAIRNKIEALPGIANFLPKVSVGINSGEMISGNIGSVTLRRLDYTVIGDSYCTTYANLCRNRADRNFRGKLGKGKRFVQL